MSFEVTLRRMTEGDRNFVLSSWLRSYAEQQTGMTRAVFFRLYEPVVVELVSRCEVVVAGLPDVGDAILGWLAASDSTVHYVFVKPRWRKLGVARRLLSDTDSLPLTYSHEPPRWVRVPERWRFDPLTRFGDDHGDEREGRPARQD